MSRILKNIFVYFIIFATFIFISATNVYATTNEPKEPKQINCNVLPDYILLDKDATILLTCDLSNFKYANIKFCSISEKPICLYDNFLKVNNDKNFKLQINVDHTKLNNNYLYKASVVVAEQENLYAFNKVILARPSSVNNETKILTNDNQILVSMSTNIGAPKKSVLYMLADDKWMVVENSTPVKTGSYYNYFYSINTISSANKKFAVFVFDNKSNLISFSDNFESVNKDLHSVLNEKMIANITNTNTVVSSTLSNTGTTATSLINTDKSSGSTSTSTSITNTTKDNNQVTNTSRNGIILKATLFIVILVLIYAIFRLLKFIMK